MADTVEKLTKPILAMNGPAVLGGLGLSFITCIVQSSIFAFLLCILAAALFVGALWRREVAVDTISNSRIVTPTPTWKEETLATLPPKKREWVIQKTSMRVAMFGCAAALFLVALLLGGSAIQQGNSYAQQVMAKLTSIKDDTEVIRQQQQQHASKADIDALRQDIRLNEEDTQRLAELEDENKSLDAALARALEAEQNGVELAAKSLNLIRTSGDASLLLAFLENLIASNLNKTDAETIELHRERAAVAYVIGEVDAAQESLDIILAHLPDDIDATNRLGAIRLFRGDLDDAQQSFQKVINQSGNTIAQAVAYSNLGIVAKTRGQFDQANQYQLQALKMNKTLDNQKGIAVNYTNLGIVAKLQGDYENAEKYQRDSLEINQQIDRPSFMASNYIELGNLSRLQGELDNAETMHNKALDIYNDLEIPAGVANCKNNIGNIMRTRGELDDAEKMFREALQINEKIGRRSGIANCCSNIATVLQARGKLDDAMAMYNRALEINLEIGRAKAVAGVYANLASLMGERGKIDDAEELYHKALDIYETLDDLEGIATVSNNLGMIALMRRNFEAAATLQRKALDIEETLGRPEGIARCSRSLALTLHMQGDLESAETWYRKSIEINEEMGDIQQAAVGYSNLGVLVKATGRLDEAEAMYRRALELCEQLPSPAGMAKNHTNLGNLFRERAEPGWVAITRQHWTTARDLHQQLGEDNQAAVLQRWIDNLPAEDED